MPWIIRSFLKPDNLTQKRVLKVPVYLCADIRAIGLCSHSDLEGTDMHMHTDSFEGETYQRSYKPGGRKEAKQKMRFFECKEADVQKTYAQHVRLSLPHQMK